MSQGQKLLEAANQPKSFRALPGAGHNDTYSAGGETYWETLETFLKELPGNQANSPVSP